MNNSLVSIIVPCYNQGQYLTEALESVNAQTYTNWECIIVDDGSIDNSKEVALSFCGKDKRFMYFYQDNQGLSATRNNAIHNSHGEYILPLDADDKIHADYIAQAVDILEKRKDVKIVYCRAEFFGDKSGEWELPPYNPEQMLICSCIFCAAMFRRLDYDQTTGYNLNMRGGLEDWNFWLSLLETGGEVYKIPHIFFYYRIKEKSMSKDMKAKEVYENLLNMLVKNHPALYRKQYISLLEKNNKLQRDLLYYKDSSFWALFSWLIKIEQQWYNIKTYIYNLLHNKE